MIKLFGENDTTFASNGDLILNPTRAIVHKEDNGSFYLDLETNLNEEKRIVEAETGTTIDINENTQILDNDTSKEMKYELLGDTYQYTTNGYNIYDGANDLYGSIRDYSQFTRTDMGNNELKLTKTTTGTTSPRFYINLNQTNMVNGETYTISCKVKGDAPSCIIGYWESSMVEKATITPNTNNYQIMSFTYTSTGNNPRIFFRNNDTTFPTNKYIIIKDFMVEKGSTRHDYEPYTGAIPAPNPSYPEPIEVVTGRQEIDVIGSNLIGNDTNQYPVNLHAGDKITFKNSGTSNCNLNLYTNYGDSARNDYWSANVGTERTITVARDSKAIAWSTSPNGNAQVNYGSTLLPYEPYIGQSYEVNLGKQLYNYSDTHYFRFDSSSTLSKTNNVITFANSLDNNRGFVWWNIPVEIGKQISISYSSITEQTEHSANGVCYLESDTPITSYVADINESTQLDKTSKKTTITITKQYLVLILRVRNINSISISDLIVNYGTPTTYAEYFTPIELCKIGNYQDKIYKDNGKWYIYKEIGKHTFSGTFQGAGVTNVFYSTSITDYLTSNNIPYSNYFKGVSNVSGASGMSPEANNSVGFINKSGGVTPRFYIKSDEFNNNSSTLNTWLRTHNTDAYYALANPTTTEITSSNYPELLEQLNAFELLSGLNNITLTSSDLTPTMKLTYNYVTGGEVTTSYIDYLQPNRILVANTPQGEQAFRIGNVEKTRTKIRLKANHIFYDTNNYVIKDSYVVEKNCNDALDHLNNATDNPSPFITTSDINTIDSYRCVRSSLYEAIQVVLERWGGHLVRNNFNIGVMDSIGDDNGVVVRYGKNLKDINAQYNWDAVVTKLMPVGQDGLLLPEEWLYSSISYDIPYTKVVSFDQSNIVQEDYQVDGVLDEEAYNQALIDDLRQKGNQYLETNSVPMVNYTLDANLERISDVGDTIEVIDERLGINILTNLISFEYNCLLEKYIQVQFGNFTPKLESLIQTIENNTTNAINENNATMRVTLSNELEQATDRIWGVLGNSYVIYDGDKILVVDALPKEDANNVLMINAGGIGFSNTGIDGTFTSAWTIDNTLNMQNINVINLTADLIKGGTLKLGSNLNQYGELEIYDEANNLIAEMNKDGLKMYGEDGSYVVLNNQEGFAGYDRNDNKIYWADGEAFHMKKSEVEEEITLCGKMRYIPIQILDVNNNITNDGIGLVSVLGGGS